VAKSHLILLAALPALMWAQAPPDFSGTWKLDPLRSRFAKVPAPKNLVLKIDQHQSAVEVKMTIETHQGESTEDFQLKASPNGSSAAWDDDHLVLESHEDTPNGPVVVTRRLKRGDKDRIMTAVVTFQGKSGVSTSYEFYVKE
jgi:hypothetical protein